MDGIQRGADDDGMTLLLAQQLEGRRTFGDFAGKFESRHEHGGDEAQAENDHEHQQAGRSPERPQHLVQSRNHELSTPIWLAPSTDVRIGALTALKSSRDRAAEK